MMKRKTRFFAFTYIPLLVVSSTLTLFSDDAIAIGKFKPSPGELRMLPAYCGPRAQPWGNDGSRPEVRRWLQVFGRDYMHMHHYCLALLSLRKASVQIDPRMRRATYEVARRNLIYMEKNVSRGFVLWPELKLLLAEAYRGLGEFGKAVVAAEAALAMKPDYGRAAVFLADLWIGMDKPEEALNVLRRAVGHGARSRAVNRRLSCLEGKGRRCPPGYGR